MWPSNMGVACNEGKSGDELRSQAPQKTPGNQRILEKCTGPSALGFAKTKRRPVARF